MHHFQVIDFVVIVLFFLIIFGITLFYSRRAGKDTKQFFLSGRNMPWYIAGTTMVATTFAADTPLAVTELVAKNGIAGNWLWWNMATGGMLTVFFFSKLWRRSGIMTDVELIEFRYSGKPAAVLRGFRAIYLGLFMNAIVMGWVNKAMEKIFHVTVPGIDPFLLVAITSIIVALYATASGLLGSARTDSFQFIFAMTGCIILAIVVVNLPSIGGTVALKGQLAPHIMSFFPKIGSASLQGITGGALALSLGAFIAYIGMQWWCSWYPGADPGGGGYIAQRMMSAKDEKNSLFATLWFNIAHYSLRPWPWILVALAALVILPRAESPEALQQENPALYQQVVDVYTHKTAIDFSRADQQFVDFYQKYENTVDPGVMYPKLMLHYLPAGLLGLLIAVFIAAYQSTISSQLNWGSSYLMNDFYKRFIKKDADEKHYVLVSRIGIMVMVTFSLIVSRFFLTTISGAWVFILNASAGMGAVLILRWFWWRINAWSEIAAMLAPLVIYPISTQVFKLQSPITLFPIAIGTTVIWLAVTFLTSPVKKETLHAFYRTVHPGGAGWKKIAAQLPDVKGDSGFKGLFLDWFAGVVLIYSALFGIGKLIFADWTGVIFLLMAVSAAAVIYFDLKKRGFHSIAD